ncbi:CRISPR-associated helicase Cas3' [Kitasatospora sp. NPDC057223]|uniref:CRISPR-associated helicase Cas3' n=1 Tax=Kitasatospora sp. NPDC057223 TaxID=3346055 RepID=UPI00364125EC
MRAVDSVSVVCAGLGLTPEDVGRLGAVFGKSADYAGGTVSPLLCHMLDTAAVAELLFDHYLAPTQCDLLDSLSGGQGRRFLAWLCGVHDIGKATPAFQRIDGASLQALRRAGLSWPVSVTAETTRRWRHDLAGGKILHTVLPAAAWTPEHVDWVWPLAAGHHGTFPNAGVFVSRDALGMGHGHRSAVWADTQRQLLEVFTAAVGYGDLKSVCPTARPSRSQQLGLSGIVVMADWIASDETHFEGLGSLDAVSMAKSRSRASKSWTELRLDGGWKRMPVPSDEDVWTHVEVRTPRASQAMVLRAAREMAAPGLLILEAPMGEGKTKGGLGALEILAARWGASGAFIGMPTQATSDPMYSHVRRWMARFQPGSEDTAVLLHGKRAFNREWRALTSPTAPDPDAKFRSVDAGQDPADGDCRECHGPAQWLLGPKRGLLGHSVVGTIDQLLHAATRTRHVMLRALGLAGKVVLLDEVHAADVYMSQFLLEGLRWLGQARVPVILMSATLPPAQRQALASAYMAGALNEPDHTADLPEPAGYPCVTTACAQDNRPVYRAYEAKTWRDDIPVRIAHLPEPPPKKQAEDRYYEQPVEALLSEELADGGVALIIRNTVTRAQRTYRHLRHIYGPDVRILHGQLTTADRAKRTETLLSRLGPGQTDRGLLIVIATQVAEQSFDIDADLLITDLAPIDLLLQRIGRLHRHQGTQRPARLTAPQVFVTGYTSADDGAAPRFEYAAEQYIYGRYPLLRTATLLHAATQWNIPSSIPTLVAEGYDRRSASSWPHQTETALQEWDTKKRERQENADRYVLTRSGEWGSRTLAGLHYAATRTTDEEQLSALVRDGEDSIEAILLIRDGDQYTTLAGVLLGPGGAVDDDQLESVTGCLLRLPTKLTEYAVPLAPLPTWRGHSLLKHMRVLTLNPDLAASLGPYEITYDREFGLTAAPISAKQWDSPHARRNFVEYQ